MSKIQEAFNGNGRPLREAERQSMDEFIAQYRGTLTTPPGMVGAKPASKPVEKPRTRRVLIGDKIYEVVGAKPASKPVQKPRTRQVLIGDKIYEVVSGGRLANFKTKVAVAKAVKASKVEKSTKPKALRRSVITF